MNIKVVRLISGEELIGDWNDEKHTITNPVVMVPVAKDQLGFTLKYREDPILLDPRNKKLGARLVINLEKLYLSLKKLDLKSTKHEETHII